MCVLSHNNFLAAVCIYKSAFLYKLCIQNKLLVLVSMQS